MATNSMATNTIWLPTAWLQTLYGYQQHGYKNYMATNSMATNTIWLPIAWLQTLYATNNITIEHHSAAGWNSKSMTLCTRILRVLWNDQNKIPSTAQYLASQPNYTSAESHLMRLILCVTYQAAHALNHVSCYWYPASHTNLHMHQHVSCAQNPYIR